jgi:hypothetical protein
MSIPNTNHYINGPKSLVEFLVVDPPSIVCTKIVSGKELKHLLPNLFHTDQITQTLLLLKNSMVQFICYHAGYIQRKGRISTTDLLTIFCSTVLYSLSFMFHKLIRLSFLLVLYAYWVLMLMTYNVRWNWFKCWSAANRSNFKLKTAQNKFYVILGVPWTITEVPIEGLISLIKTTICTIH